MAATSRGLAIDITNIVLNVKELTLTKDGFHDLGMACLYGLLGSGGNDSATLGVTGLVLGIPLTIEDTLVL
jgi:hypothetical protein